jgi:acyl-CoA reductase-like NAD-dependent aldehyde dehydrogenase
MPLATIPASPRGSPIRSCDWIRLLMPLSASFLPGAKDRSQGDHDTMDGRLFLNNTRIETENKKESINPASLESLGQFCLASSSECREAVRAADEAFPAWSELPDTSKKKIFKRAKSILLQKSEEIAALITQEKGSPFIESLLVEILGSLEAFDYYGRHSGRIMEPSRAKHHVTYFSHKKSSFSFSPLGPTLVISPWNFPFVIPICEILSALSAGNTVVLRPSTSTPFVALRIGELFQEAGLPQGVLNVINCQIPQAEEMITNPQIQSIMFTGSAQTGKKIMALASRNLTNVVLELGGKDPMIVLDDAHLERSVRGAVWGAFTNCGQVCSSIERVYVQKNIAEPFTDRVIDLVGSLRVGDPMEKETDLGSLTLLSQIDVIEDHIQDALEKGARLLAGGKRIKERRGYFFQPTVLADVNHSMKVMTEETFGPVMPIMTFSEPEEAVRLANDSDYGLTASVWTRDKKKASKIAAQLHVGTVTVNDHMFSFVEPGALWGGVKQTGIGRSHGLFGQMELVNIKYISEDYSRKKTQLWWYPYHKDLAHIFQTATHIFHHDRLANRLRALPALLPFLSHIQKGSPLGNYIKGIPRWLKK